MGQNPLEEFKRLHRLYLYSDYKISDLAQYLNVSRRTVERWISGRCVPPESKINMIARFLKDCNKSV